MTNRLLTYAIAALVGIVFVCVGGLSMLGGAVAATQCGGAAPVPTTTGAAGDPSTSPGPSPFPAVMTPHGTWNPSEVDNAATIAAVGVNDGIPPHGWVIAVATAMQESGLRNLGNLGANNDHDSLGLFQQRPSQGWGTPAQIMNPTHASESFYAKLLTVTGWQTMPLTQAAQAVQRSAFPDAYATWEPDATHLITAITGNTDLAAADDCTIAADVPSDFTLPPDTPQPVVDAIAWAFEQLGTPYHLDGDCTAAHSGIPAHQCDCSSLVQQAYQAAGITLPRTAAEQSHIGQLITDPKQLAPGDLIFIVGAPPGTRKNPGHVGMYLGHNLIIEAPETGKNVQIVRYDGSWITAKVAIRRNVQRACRFSKDMTCSQ